MLPNVALVAETCAPASSDNGPSSSIVCVASCAVMKFEPFRVRLPALPKPSISWVWLVGLSNTTVSPAPGGAVAGMKGPVAQLAAFCQVPTRPPTQP